MDYTITEVLGVKPNVYQGKSGVRFKVEGVEHQLSALTDNPSEFEVGKTIHGSIVPKEKDGKTFYNFNAGKKVAKPDTALLYISRNVDATLQAVQKLTGDFKILIERLENKGVLDKIGEPTGRFDYHDFPEEPTF